jgi:hypothetical protein
MATDEEVRVKEERVKCPIAKRMREHGEEMKQFKEGENDDAVGESTSPAE